jgi:hypothetical protein
VTESFCVLCDWTPDISAAPLAVYRPGERFPLRWGDHGPEPVRLSDSISDTWMEVAAVHHWAVAHRAQLHGAIGDYDVDVFPRSHW